MCWIRGSLYRVSANKLSRTAASSMSINRTGTLPRTVWPFDGTEVAQFASSRDLHLAKGLIIIKTFWGVFSKIL